jgi:cytochrome d ubiquinol oxidase subunit II
MLLLFSIAGAWVATQLPGYELTSALDPAGPANPLAKTVATGHGAWLANYARYPLAIAVPVLGYAGVLAALACLRLGAGLAAFFFSALAMTGIIGTAGVSMFPFVMPSSSDPRSSLTAWDSVSSHLTLGIMFWATLIFMPIVVGYTAWAYRVMAGKVTASYIRQNEHSAY